MPSKAGNSTKTLSRMAIIRQNANQKMVDAALSGDMDDALYGRVVKIYGGAGLSVMTKDKREHRAQIRGLLRRKGATPIAVGDVVILGRREFESRKEGEYVGEIGGAEVFDVVGIMDHRAALKAVKDGIIPKWMQTGQEEKGPVDSALGARPDDDGFEFDYDAAEPAEGEEDEKLDVAAARKAKEMRLERRAGLMRAAVGGGAGREDDDIDIDRI
jgi:translation initiation factor IF-1